MKYFYIHQILGSPNIFNNNFFMPVYILVLLVAIWQLSCSCDCVNFGGSQVSSFDFSTLYTLLPHDLIKAKMLSLVNWRFNRESKTYLCTSVKAGLFSNKKYDSCTCWSCAELCEAFTFLMENMCNLMAWYINK